MATTSTGEQALAEGTTLMWVGKDAPRKRSGGWLFAAGDDGTLVRQFDAYVAVEFRGPGAVGLVAGPTHTMYDGDETMTFGTVEVAWTDKIGGDYGSDFIRFSDGSQVVVRDNGVLAEVSFLGVGLLIVRRVLDTDGKVRAVTNLGATNSDLNTCRYPEVRLGGSRRGVLLPA